MLFIVKAQKIKAVFVISTFTSCILMEFFIFLLLILDSNSSNLEIDFTKLREKCGVFGVYGKDFGASQIVYYGLWALQHRGQEATGISATDGKTIRTKKGEGLVSQVFTDKDLNFLKGHAAIGHNRYGTSGVRGAAHPQPFTNAKNKIALAHNGNLPSTKKLEEFLQKNNVKTEGFNDSELMQLALEFVYLKTNSVEKAVKECFPLFTGSFCLVILTKDELVAVRDSYGIRPLCLGKLNKGYVVASETCAIDAVYGKYIRDIQPGEMIVVDKKGLRSYELSQGIQKLDVFEFIYFARRDSVLLGKSVNQVRRNLGIELARECANLKADLVIPVPDSGIPAALGFAFQSGIPFDHGFVKNRYVHRTFIRPLQSLREVGVTLKINPLPQVLGGKSVVVVDDSIVRGTTTKKIIAMLKKAGAKKVHMLVSSPPIKYPDFYGIDTPDQSQLIAAKMSVPAIKKYLGADTLHYLSYQGLFNAIGLPESMFCTALFTGDYPIDILERKTEIKYSK